MKSAEHLSFSDELEHWLKGKGPKTIAGLTEVFGEKSFAIIMLLLMAIPALPLPTGGVTHVFEVITVLLALEMIIGLRKFWLPKKWQAAKLGPILQSKAVGIILRRIRWFEKWSNPRMKAIFEHTMGLRLLGVLIIVFTVFAFIAPPFSGLDTLPALGVVIISLAIILDDALILLLGAVIGGAGVALVIGLGTALVTFIKHLF